MVLIIVGLTSAAIAERLWTDTEMASFSVLSRLSVSLFNALKLSGSFFLSSSLGMWRFCFADVRFPNLANWSNKTKQAIQLGYANHIIYSNILLFDLKKGTEYIEETEQDSSVYKHTSKTIS